MRGLALNCGGTRGAKSSWRKRQPSHDRREGGEGKEGSCLLCRSSPLNRIRWRNYRCGRFSTAGLSVKHCAIGGIPLVWWAGSGMFLG